MRFGRPVNIINLISKNINRMSSISERGNTSIREKIIFNRIYTLFNETQFKTFLESKIHNSFQELYHRSIQDDLITHRATWLNAASRYIFCSPSGVNFTVRTCRIIFHLLYLFKELNLARFSFNGISKINQQIIQFK